MNSLKTILSQHFLILLKETMSETSKMVNWNVILFPHC